MLKLIYKEEDGSVDITKKKFSFRQNLRVRKIINFMLRQRVERLNLSTLDTNKDTVRAALLQNIFSLFSHRLLKVGKKQYAESIFNKVTFGLRARGYVKPLQLIADVLLYLKPTAAVYNKKRGRKIITVPYLLNIKTEIPMAIRWLIKSARARSEKGIVNQLIAEIIDANERKGASVMRKNELETTVSKNLPVLKTLRLRYRRKKRFSLPRFGRTR